MIIIIINKNVDQPFNGFLSAHRDLFHLHVVRHWIHTVIKFKISICGCALYSGDQLPDSMGVSLSHNTTPTTSQVKCFESELN